MRVKEKKIDSANQTVVVRDKERIMEDEHCFF